MFGKGSRIHHNDHMFGVSQLVDIGGGKGFGGGIAWRYDALLDGMIMVSNRQVHRKFAVESSGFIEPDDGGAEVFANRINHCNEFVHAAQFTSQLTFAVHAHAKVHALLIEEVSEGGQPIRHINMH